jgi:stress response protein SCP2
MSVNLTKGQKVELRKSDGGNLRRVVVGLGWDEAQPQKKGFFAALTGGGQAIDCDASAIICTNERLMNKNDIVYFGNLTHQSGSVKHMGDNLTGAGDGDDEQIMVDLERVPMSCDKIVFVVNIYQARQRNQQFGMIRNAFIRIFDAETNQELCKYNLSENYTGMTAMIFGELYRNNGAWKFNAIGQATQDNDIDQLAARYQ